MVQLNATDLHRDRTRMTKSHSIAILLRYCDGLMQFSCVFGRIMAGAGAGLSKIHALRMPCAGFELWLASIVKERGARVFST